ncbi:hypothetical protein HYZ64_03280, partial [Candidatus Berkelbacteria bacterium]|nr:hypothetical protein [Candidatus Berkelbacteria bacterium]
GELSTNYETIRPGDINPAGPGQRRSSGLISVRDLLDWINGKRLTKDLVLSVGSRQVENSLELPPLSIFYTLKEQNQSPETFFRAVGRAQYEQYFGRQPIRVALAQNTPDRIDAILGIGTGRQSISGRLASQELTTDQYFERVGKEVLLLRGVNLLGLNVEFGGLSFTPYDIYDILSGNGRPAFERVAARQFEQVLDLPQSVFYRLLHAPSSDDKRLAMADVASHYFGNLLGIGALPIFGVPEEIQGRYAVEATLGLQPGTFRDSLEKVIERNQPINFAIAFRMIEPSSSLSIEGYDAKRLQDAIEILSLPQTLNTVHPQQDAQNYLTQLNGDPIVHSTGAWGLIEQFRRGEVSKAQLEGTLEQVDKKLRLEIGTTEKLLKGQLATADYAKKAGGFSITDTLARSPILIDQLADVLGLEGTARDNFHSQFPIVFDLMRRNSITDVANWRPEDRQSFYSALDTTFSLRFDSKLGVRRGTFALLAAAPENARKVFLTEGVFKIENQFGLNNGVDDGPLTRVYNAYANADQAIKNQTAMQQAETELSFAVQREIFERTVDKKGQGGISMPLDDTKLLIHGDMRFLGLVAAADMAGSLNKDRDGNALPVDRQITYQVIADAFRDPPNDMALIQQAFNSGLDRGFEKAGKFGLKGQDAQDFAERFAYLALNDEVGRVRSQRKSELQFRLIDNQLYKADINIPSGFARAMFEGTTEQRTESLLNYTENLINNHETLGVQLPRGSLVVLEKYIEDPNDRNFDRLVSTGVLGTFDEFMVDKKLFGKLWRQGTAEALLRFGQTGQLGNISTPGTIVGIYGQWALVEVFGFMDSKMGWQVGNAAQIYFATQNFLHAKAVFEAAQAADALGESTQLANSSGQMQAAARIMIEVVVSIVFAKQVAQVEQAIGLVPGTGIMFLSLSVSALLGVAINPITLGLFIALNLFGFNKVKIFVLCTGDGYYPQLESANPELSLGLPEFNGMAAAEYREGLKRAARARVNGLISDMIEMPYYFVDKNFVGVRQEEPDFSTKVAQIITARQEDLLAFFGSDRYKQVFNEDAPSKDNRQGISISPLTTEYVHIGF